VLFIILSILCSVMSANLLMYYKSRREVAILPVFLGNYFAASLFSYAVLDPSNTVVRGIDLGFGVLTGMLFLLNFIVYQRNIIANGLSISVGVMRIAVVVPLLLSVLVFDEKISGLNLIGIVLALSVFSFRSDRRELRNILLILLLFMVSGLTDSTLKLFDELGGGGSELFVYLVFTSAFMITLLGIVIGRIRVELRSIGFGLVLGIPNRFSTVFFLMGLERTPAAVAYPATAAGIMLMSILSDVLIWKRLFSLREGIMFAVLAISVVLVNL